MTLTEFQEDYCKGRAYDSCANSPCPYSNHSEGCIHPMHPQNITHYHLLYCPICRSDSSGNYRLYSRDALRHHLGLFHRRYDIDDLMVLANDFTAHRQWIMNGIQRLEAASCGQ